MKHLLSGVALAALLTAGVPALAQTSTDKQSGTAATGATTSMPAGTDNAQSGASTGATANAPSGPAKASKPPTAANAQSGTAATGASTSTAAETDNATSGTSTPSDSTGKPGKHMKSGAAAKHEQSASDNMAEELNRQELQRVQNGGGQMSGSSQSQAPGAGTSPSRAPASGIDTNK